MCSVHFVALCLAAPTDAIDSTDSSDVGYLSVFIVKQMLGGSLLSCRAAGKKPCTAPLT